MNLVKIFYVYNKMGGRKKSHKKCEKDCSSSSNSSSSSVERFSESKVKVKNIHYKRHGYVKRHIGKWSKHHESCSKSG